MARAKIIIDPLTAAERRRIEALALSIAMAPNRYPTPDSYLTDAETIERWIIEANAPPPPQTEDEFWAARDEAEFGA